MANVSASLDMLPSEMLEKILMFLNYKRICQAKLICKRFREIIVKGNLVKKASGKILVHFLSMRIFHILCFYIYVTLGIIQDLRVHQIFHILDFLEDFFHTFLKSFQKINIFRIFNIFQFQMYFHQTSKILALLIFFITLHFCPDFNIDESSFTFLN